MLERGHAILEVMCSNPRKYYGAPLWINGQPERLCYLKIKNGHNQFPREAPAIENGQESPMDLAFQTHRGFGLRDK